jgi:hypothetical protein
MIIQLELTDAQVDQLREVMDSLPLRTHAPLICAVLPQLPFTESVVRTPSGADTVPEARSPSGPPGGLSEPRVAGNFKMTAFTPRGVSMLEALDRVLCKMGDGE